MNIVIEPCYALPCATKVFTINGIEADLDDFGTMGDMQSGIAGPYSCTCMCFTASSDKNVIEKTMRKYNITYDEFKTVQENLESAMYVGSCGWCT